MSEPRRRLAVVTGGSTGIGRACVNALASAGWNVAFSYFRSPAEAEQTAASARVAGADVLALRCDVGVKAEVDEFYEQVDLWHGAPDLLVNNAGIQTWASLLELEEASWDRVIRTNLKGCFLNTQTAARRMVAAGKGGAVVNIGSGCNKLAFPKLVDYTASKGGIEQLTKVAAVELGPHGIRVNCVAPGAIEIERTQAEAGDYAATWSAITPMRRVGRPDDVAALVLYLASPAAAFISGQTVWVDGGVFSQANWPYERNTS
ncbi:SDR family NAD(P)-dependent oxidoreductase [Peristeroidobacter agariperforans]|uniref:SDR family NAD(P)-dependent oxidoreductase n=1 Tax=Peristeroidobacter agariperforans TaxID=268404 RepID=UPI00101DC3E6|nr:SDR family NAD(P)-dependent oxidoreductase [Peristeroidobacter agariperforans]